MMSRLSPFQIVVYGVLVTYAVLFCLVVFVTQTRKSGSTGIDASRIQQMRYEAQMKEIE